MFGITLFGLFLWGLLFVAALAICWLSTQPGQRRKRREVNYCGPERRADPTETDFLAEPMFNRPDRHIRKDRIHTITTTVVTSRDERIE